MKNKLSLIFAICAMFASCDKSTSPVKPDPTPSTDTEKTVVFLWGTMTDDGHKDFFDLQFEFDVNGTKVAFKESEMTETTPQEATLISGFAETVNKTFVFYFGPDHKKTAKYYKYPLGKLKIGETVSAVSVTPIIKSDRPSVEEISFFLGNGIYVEGKKDVIDRCSYHVGIPNIDAVINVYFTKYNKTFKGMTYTYSK